MNRAALAGLDDSASTMNAACQAAQAVIAAHERTELHAVDRASFFAALDQPPEATLPLKAALERHCRIVLSG